MLFRSRASIDAGTLSEVKYFSAPHFKGTLRSIPKVVVGADQATIHDVSQLLLDFKFHQGHPPSANERLSEETREGLEKKFLDVRGRLERHPLQFQLLFEIRAQLTAFKEYASSKGKPALAEVYGRALTIIEGIIETKRPPQPETLEKDQVFKLILDHAANFGKSPT